MLLLFGGRSAEHDVSRVSAVAVARALDPDRYEVVPVAITTEGRWLLAGEARAAARGRARRAARRVPGRGHARRRGARPGQPRARRPSTPAPSWRTSTFDVVLPLLHGPYGEDGTVQGLLRAGRRAVRRLGRASAPRSHGQGDDEARVRGRRAADRRAGSRSATATTVDAFVDRVEAKLGYPVLREAGEHGLVGRRVEGASTAPSSTRRVDVALAFDEWILVEEAIVGREIEVGVLGDDPPEASVPGEIVPGDEFYSYADKYEDDAAELLAPAPLDDAQTERGAARSRCGRSRRAGARRWRGSTSSSRRTAAARGFLVNEVNTIPGFTPISMYPRLWEVSGVPVLRAARPAHRARARPPRPPRPPRRAPTRASTRRADARRYRLTTGQVKVRVMPSTAWICETTSLPRSSRLVGLGAHDHVVGPGDVVGGDDAADRADRRRRRARPCRPRSG